MEGHGRPWKHHFAPNDWLTRSDPRWYQLSHKHWSYNLDQDQDAQKGRRSHGGTKNGNSLLGEVSQKEREHHDSTVFCIDLSHINKWLWYVMYICIIIYICMCVCLDDLWLILYVLLCAYKINACLSLSLSLSSAGLASQMPFAAPFGKGCKMEEVMVISYYDNSVQRYMYFHQQ